MTFEGSSGLHHLAAARLPGYHAGVPLLLLLSTQGKAH